MGASLIVRRRCRLNVHSVLTEALLRRPGGVCRRPSGQCLRQCVLPPCDPPWSFNDVSAYSGNRNRTAGSRTQGRASKRQRRQAAEASRIGGGGTRPFGYADDFDSNWSPTAGTRGHRQALAVVVDGSRTSRIAGASSSFRDIPRSWHDFHPPVGREPPSIAGGSASSLTTAAPRPDRRPAAERPDIEVWR